MHKIIEKAVLKHCGRLTKSFYLEAILRDKEIIASNISEQDVIDFLHNCDYLQKIGEIRCPKCCHLLSYYDVEELEEDEDLECPDCDYEFAFDKYCTCYRYNVLHNKLPKDERKLNELRAIDMNTGIETIARKSNSVLQETLKRKINELDKYHDGIVSKHEVFKIIDKFI